MIAPLTNDDLLHDKYDRNFTCQSMPQEDQTLYEVEFFMSVAYIWGIKYL